MTAPAAAAGFDDHTALRTDDPGGLRAEADPAWSGFAGAHGGWVAAVALRAAAHAVADGGRPPRSLSVQLVAPVRPGLLELSGRRERHGRTLSSASVRAVQNGAPAAIATASFGAAAGSHEHTPPAMPAVPPPEDCAPLLDKPVPESGAGWLVEHRPAAEPLPLSGADRAELSVWMRLGERRPVDAVLATFLADAAAPALYASLTEPLFMPTIDLSVQYAPALARPRGAWVLGAFRAVAAADGYAWEDGELWGVDGELLLRARQLRRVAG